VGDAPNDLEILQTAGLAAAMGNAADSIKEICDVIVSDNDHNGVLEVITRYFLGNGQQKRQPYSRLRL
jgi:hydroxymethylpyrimidine pyrophosphatase-like HAD family hydrolase